MLMGMNSGHASMADWGMSMLNINAPRDVLDIGCGGGRNAGEFLKRYPDAKVTAIDYSPLSVKKAREYNRAMIEAGRCSVLEGNAAALEFGADSFDLVSAFETVYFWPGLPECFREVRRVLRTGGTFIVVNEMDGLDPAGKKFEAIIEGMKDYTAGEIEEAMRASGFSEVRTVHHETKSWMMITAIK